MTLLALLVALVIVGLVFWAARALLTAFAVGDPIRTVVYVILVIVAIIYLLGLVGLGPALRLT